jgi:hypothetical protein
MNGQTFTKQKPLWMIKWNLRRTEAKMHNQVKLKQTEIAKDKSGANNLLNPQKARRSFVIYWK